MSETVTGGTSAGTSTGISAGEGAEKSGRVGAETAEGSVFAGLQYHIIARRELEKILTIPRAFFFLVAAIIVPVITAYVSDVNSYPVEIQALMLKDILFFTTYFWVGGMVLVFSSAWIVSDFIAGEDSRGTLLSLITKPIHRWEVILGKFLAYLAFVLVLELIAIILSIYLLVTVSGSHLSVVWDLIPYVPILLAYTLFVAVVFGTIPLALSTVSKSRVMVMTLSTALIIVMYLGFYIIRSGFSDFYVDYQLYHFDLGYHMGNIFLSFTDTANIEFTPDFQEQMGLFAGTHDLDISLDEPDQGFQLASIPLTDYYSRLVSWLIWTLIPIGLTAFSIFKLNEKEIQ